LIRVEFATEKIIDILNGKYRRFDLGTTRIFFNENEFIGVVDYFLIEKSLFIKNFQVATRRKGHGKLLINFLFETLEIEDIQGCSINKTTDAFWKSLNANFTDIPKKGMFRLDKSNLI